jgi:radical SAM superfamily enzyme YgiQ (UPF0313 family)
LRSVHKGFNRPDEYAQVVERLHQRSIALQACFVFGLDDDTPEVFQRTAEFAVQARIDLPRYAIATPFPGTPLFRQLDAQQRILTRDWSLYDGQHVVFQPKNVTAEQLLRGTRQAWQCTYRWSNIIRRLRHTAAPPLVALGTNLGYRFYANHLDRYYTCDGFTHLPTLTGKQSEKTAQPERRTESQSREETYA